METEILSSLIGNSPIIAVLIYVLRYFLARNKEVEGSVQEQCKAFLEREDLLREEWARREGILRGEFERSKEDLLKIISEFSLTMVNVSISMCEIKDNLSEMNFKISNIETKIEANS
ncbi:hypothetical protein FACS1894188_11950 [Clostridia bacterium]|nr:hypothetical protein FACS1894188_11950 [Clostridia bacterium]